jgi:hypothetical protein
VRIEIQGHDLPGRSCGPSPDSPGGYHNIHVGVQRRNAREELLGLLPGDAPSANWSFECTPSVDGTDLKGPYIQGSPGGRFIYLSWGTVDSDQAFRLFRRAKLMLDAVPPDVLSAAAAAGVLVGRLGLTDRKGNPVCASVRPPEIEWRAGDSISH